MNTAAQPHPKRKAIALLSGGLDSLLAAKLVRDQGVDVLGLHLLSPFGCREDVQKVADTVGIPLLFKEKGAAYLDLVENPRFGYGKNMNPCIDCRVFMFQLADVVRQENGADFIVTGEVLGQRPMSQHRHAFEMIESQSPLEGLVVRPLSAGKLDPSLPEKEGWVNRDLFLNISGRGRVEQMALAEKYGVKEYASPAGGCLLTDANFSARLKDFFNSPTFQSEEEKLKQSELLSVGRYFRLGKTRVTLGRNHAENLVLRAKGEAAGGRFVEWLGGKGPKALFFGEDTQEIREWTARLIGYFSVKEFPGQAEFRLGTEESGEKFSCQGVLTEAEILATRVGVN